MLGALASASVDPLLGRTSGIIVRGVGKSWHSINSTALESSSGMLHTISIFTHTVLAASGPDVWLHQISAKADKAASLTQARAAHELWWAKFWNRSWISLTNTNGTPNATLFALSQAYTLTRYLTAIQSRGQFPIHHNGGTRHTLFKTLVG